MSKNIISENATAGTLIGSLAARDEDTGQKLSFLLVNDDGGRFALSGNKLVTAKSLDHESNKRHVITVSVVDNGYNALKVNLRASKARLRKQACWHHPTLLNARCWPCLNTVLDDVGLSLNYLLIYRTICLFLSNHLSMYLVVHLTIYLMIKQSILRSI